MPHSKALEVYISEITEADLIRTAVVDATNCVLSLFYAMYKGGRNMQLIQTYFDAINKETDEEEQKGLSQLSFEMAGRVLNMISLQGEKLGEAKVGRAKSVSKSWEAYRDKLNKAI